MNANKFGYKCLTFLLENANKTLTGERWAALFGIKIIDWDGWRKHHHEEEIDLNTFLARVSQSTINPLP